MRHGDVVQKRYRSFNYDTINGWRVNKVFAGWIFYGPTFKFRFDPVPGTGNHRTSYHGVRHMKTTQERRLSCDIEHKEYIRGARNIHNLPNAWDDHWYAKRTKGWKRTKNKKRQWMKKGDSFYEKRKYDLD